MSSQRRFQPAMAFVRFARNLAAGALLFALGTAPAFANAGMGVQVIFPPSISVGQTDVAGTIDIQNTSTPDTLTIALNTITLVPSCGAYSIITCTQLDPGVLSIDTPAVGRALTACAGISFTVAPTGQPDGSYSFTPASTVTLGTPGSATDRCIIDFTFDVLKAPTKDANGASNGLQTLPSATVTGTANDTSQAVGFGTAFFVTVNPATPTIVTTASSAVVAGGNIFDTATLAGGTSPTGTITFKLYGPNDATCAGPAIFTNVKNVNGNGNYQSDPFGANLVGTYRWIASYSGDANNAAVSGACNDANESVAVTPGTPSLTTSASAAIKLGGTVTDTATLLSGISPTGSITFKLYGPNDATCANAPVFTSNAVTVNGNGNYTSTPAYTPTAIGTYRWIASYSGDANNNPITGNCNDANESVVVNQATPTIATQASGNVVIGGSVTDTATIAGGVNPTGTIIFRLYGPMSSVSCVDSGAGANLVFTSAPITVNGNGVYGPSGSFTPTVPGTYRWRATYSGDTNNAGVAGVCGATGETVMIQKATPGLSTQASAGGVIGVSVNDSATLTGGYGTLTGTLIFRLYGPAAGNTCTEGAGGNLVYTSPAITVNGTGTYGPSGSFTPTVPGTYRWRATYSGDANNAAVTGTCGATNESVTITKATPTIATVASAGGPIGTLLSDVATVSGGSSPTGTVTFNLYGPNNASCSGSPIFTSTNALAAGSATSGSFTTLAAGVYRWTATYNGDANNNSVSHPCNSTNESATITQTTPTIATVATTSGAIGTSISDVATVTGSSPTGTVTFNLYGPNDASCSGASIFTATVALAAGSASSGSFTPSAPGTYRWTASYSGDANNIAVSHPCNSANETSTISKRSPTIATVASAGGNIGTQLTDTATLSGALNPTGSITFNLYGPNDATCSGAVIFTSTVALSGSSATSAAFTTTAAGVYRWTASYPGDANNNAISHPCNSANESATINKSTPSIATVASAGGNIGTQLTDTATVSGGSSPTGTVTFNLYGPNDAACSGAVIATSTIALAAGSATSSPFTTTAAGVYRWTATYNGDANNNSVAHPCNSANESATINKSTPTIATVASAGGNIGTQLTDTATVSGGTNPTGTVSFSLYGPNDATCSNAPVFTSGPIALVAGSATSAAFTTTAAGVYRWTASYSGDANNNSVSHPCNSANESATINKSTPSILTVASAGGNIGAQLTDTATVSGGTNPTGTVTFNLYGPNDATCSGSSIFTSTVALAAGSATSGAFTTVAAGVYRWTATYSGDANNNTLTHPCNSPNETATIVPPKEVPTVATTASAGGPLGTALTDSVTVTSPTNPTGTVIFALYGPNDASCSGTAIFTSTVALTGGSATSGSFTPTAPGVYRWTALYSGDSNNNGVAHPCNAPNESATITKATPTIATVASAGGPIGTQVSDTATVSGGSSPTGTVTFNLYGPNDATCSGTAVFTATVPLAAGSASSGSFTTTAAGVYRWTADYSGDANNNAVAHPCNSANESVTITPTTLTLVTQTAPVKIVGDSITDTATLSGGTNPTGTITFRLYGPNDANCSNAPIFTSSAVTVNGNGSYPSSPSFTAVTAGVYRWIASYSGDANNSALSGACNDANENVTVTSPLPPPPTVPVPTLSEWALMLLIMLMGAVTMASLRKRRR